MFPLDRNFIEVSTTPHFSRLAQITHLLAKIILLFQVMMKVVEFKFRPLLLRKLCASCVL
jgi:hypothetical protein